MPAWVYEIVKFCRDFDTCKMTFLKKIDDKIIESGPRNIFTGVHSNLKYKSQSPLGEREYEKSINKQTKNGLGFSCPKPWTWTAL